ncbi:MAG TPA: energy transducer TonB [Rhodanobacteraceae bacterium]|nr:energy transducer TonB [Rhodanobacteraceae bacterium]
MKRVACSMLSLLIPALGLAAQPHVEGSMLVTGTITVNPDGGVRSYTVQDLDKLPPAVRQIIQTTVSRWQFVPITAGGKAVAAEAGMSLRIVADMVDAQHATISIAGAAFGCDARPKSNLPGECPAGTAIRYVHREPPSYPVDALKTRVGGEVFLVLQVGRDGRVAQAAVRQVNLYSMTDHAAHYRDVLAEATLLAASKWRFRVPTAGPSAAKDHWVVQVPVNYTVGVPRDACGAIPCSRASAWTTYVPGPVQDIPWSDEGKKAGSPGGSDAIAGGALFMRDDRFVLKAPPQGGTGQS